MKPIMQNSKVGLTSADTIPLRPVTLVEKMLYASHLFKASMSHHLQDGHNVLSCRGAARAFSKQFYHQLTWPDSVPEDAYSFFLCKQLHFKFIFVPLAQVFLRLPQSLQDHVSQSHRFFLGHKRLEHYFSRSFIRKNYHIPRQALLTGFMKTFRLYPWQLAAYTIMMFGVHFLLPKQKGHASRFTAALSSKKLVS